MPKLRFSEPNYFQIKKQYLQNNNALVIAKVLKTSCFFYENWSKILAMERYHFIIIEK